MKLAERYLLREYLKHLAYCLTAFLMIFVLWDLFDHVGRFLEVRPSAAMLVRYYVCLLAPTIEYILPASLLLATLYTLWQMARHNEIVAMRASGIGLLTVVRPFLLVGFVGTLVIAAIKETVAPASAEFVRLSKDAKFADESEPEAARLDYVNPRGHLEWHADRFWPSRPGHLENVSVKWDRGGDTTRPAREIRARRAEWLDGEWWFFEALERVFNDEGYPMGGFRAIAHAEQGVRLPELTDRPGDFVLASRQVDFLSTRDILRYLSLNPRVAPERKAEYLVTFHSRLALPWACLILTLFAVPAGTRSSRQGVIAGVIASIALFVAFYGLTVLGLFLGKTQAVEPWLGAWLSNIVFATWGLILLARMR